MSFRSWKQYFEENQSHFSAIDWKAEDILPIEQRNIIAGSIAQFQKGENSEGKHLFNHAKKYSDPEYLECIKWNLSHFKENSRHGKYNHCAAHCGDHCQNIL